MNGWTDGQIVYLYSAYKFNRATKHLPTGLFGRPIYRSVLSRRSRHQRQKNRSMSAIMSQRHHHRSSARPTSRSIISTTDDSRAPPAAVELVVLAGAELVVLAGAGSERPVTTAAAAATTSADDVMQQSARDRKRNRVANVKTAAMLFVVTVVFVVTFLPAFLMTVHLLPYNVVIFYMYFANNVANPIIYSFNC